MSGLRKASVESPACASSWRPLSDVVLNVLRDVRVPRPQVAVPVVERPASSH